MISKQRGLERLRKDEPPVIVLDHEGFLKSRFATTQYLDELLAEADLIQ